MNLRQLVCLVALASGTVAVAAAADTPVVSSSNGSSSGEITVTKEELAALIAEVKAEVASNPDIAAIFDTIDLDSLLSLTPEQARAVLNEKVFDATAPPSSASNSTDGSLLGTDSPPATDAVSTATPGSQVPAPAPASGGASLTGASAAAAVATVVVYALQ